MEAISTAEFNGDGITIKLIDASPVIRIETDLLLLETQIFLENKLQSSGTHKTLTDAVKSHSVSAAALRGDNYVNLTMH